MKSVIQKLLRDKNASIWLWIGFAALFLGAFLVISSEVQEASSSHPELIGTIDKLSATILGKIQSPRLNGLAVDLTALGSTTVMTIFILITSVLMFFRRKFLQVIQLILAGLGSAALTWLMKSYFQRPRPDGLTRLVEVQGYSYPSGHSVVGAAIYFTFAILLCQEFRRPLERAIIMGFAFAFIFLIAISRVYLGAHYISDVIAGMLVGIGWASLLGAFSSFIEIRKS